MSYIDFKYLKTEIQIEQAAHALGLKMGKPPQMRGPCPTCKEGGDRALAINTAKQSFYCFAAREGGDVIGLTAHVQGISQKEAATWLAEQFLQVPAEAGRVQNSSLNSSPAPPAGMAALDYLEADHAAVEVLGFDVATAKALGIGYAGKGIMRGLVAVPVRLPDGTLAGYIGVTECRLPSRFHLGENVLPMQKKGAA